MTTPSNAHLEARLEQFFRKTIRTLGGHTIKLPPVEPGVPDRLVFMPGGRIYLVELKAMTGALRPAQVEWHRRMALLDIPVAVLYGQQGVKDWVRTIFNPPEDDD